jgi:MFS family permease
VDQVSSLGRRHAVLLVLISCLPILGTLLIAPVLPDMARHFASQPGVDYLIPFVQTAPACVLAIIGTPVGALAARYGRKRILILSMLLYAVAAPFPLLLPSLGEIILSRLLVGVAEAGVMTTATTLIGDYFTGAKRDRYLGCRYLRLPAPR